jgi:uroporphyrinogen-III decarboxylase
MLSGGIPDRIPVIPQAFLLSAQTADVLRISKQIIHATKGRGLILSSGCAIGANAKPENAEAMVEASKRFGTKEMLEELQSE